MNNMKKESLFTYVAIAVFVAAFFCPKITKAFEDNTPPEITSFSVSPLEFDTSESRQTITVTIGISDSGVGICPSSVPGCPSTYGGITIHIQPMIGNSTQDVMLLGFDRISGDSNNGVYRGYQYVPYGSKSGLWQVTSIQLIDIIGNVVEYVPNNSWGNIRDLNTIPDATGLQIANTATSSQVTIDKEWTLSSSTVSVTFPKDTIVTKKEGGSFAIYQMVNRDFSISDVTTDGLDTADTNNIVGKIKIGIPGLNLSFSKPVTLQFKVDSKYEGQTLEIQTLEESGGSWANETTCTVSNSKCSFTVNHASYFAVIKKPANSTFNGTVTGGTVTGSADGNIVVGTDTPTLAFSTSKKAKRNINLTFSGLSLTKKQWVKVRLNGRKVTTARVRRSGNDSIVTISFKYGKWAVGSYSLSMIYKNQIKIPYIKKGKTKYRKGWESGTVNSENILSII